MASTWERRRRSVWGGAGVLALVLAACAGRSGPVAAGEAQSHAGLVPVEVAGGRVTLTLPPPTDGDVLAEHLLLTGLRGGLGSNPVGIDRGELGDQRVVRWRLVGDRVLLEAPNLRFRADSDDPAEVRATAESFATAVLWAGYGDVDGRGVRVDITDLLLSDLTGVAGDLAGADQGRWQVDPDRSVVLPDGVFVFPDNLILESQVTWTGGWGSEVAAVSPVADTVSLVQAFALVRLPDDAYTPRAWHPRGGAFARTWRDQAAPLDAPVTQRVATRHRLSAGDRLVYYVDRGAPEPVRSALVEGASWWADAFAPLGIRFEVALTPEGVHPLDVRYDVVQWVHRATRGWSYGAAVTDPRTGEILKGHVSLGSLRVRHDRMLFEGLLGASDPAAVELALARIRQLAAHEVGHTLGLAHNFAASTQGRASVMDYPAPLLRVEAGALDHADAYAVGIGAWDVAAVRWLYGDGTVPPGDQRYLTDADARGPATAHPHAALWDNGPDAVAALEDALAVRAWGLARFGPHTLSPGRPLAELNEVFAPLWLHHRYQVDAVAKAVGGVDYSLGVVGDGRPVAVVAAADQRRALDALLAALSPRTLAVPEDAQAWLMPPARGEVLAGRAGPVFDPHAAAETAAGLVLDALLRPARAQRLVVQASDPDQLSWREVLGSTRDAVFAHDGVWAQAAQRVFVERLLGLSGATDTPPAVRAEVDALLRTLVNRLKRAESSLAAGLVRRIRKHGEQGEVEVQRPLPAPPGSPIGCGG